jgi:hypothetical protein
VRIYLLLICAFIYSGCSAKNGACLKGPEVVEIGDSVVTRGGRERKKCRREAERQLVEAGGSRQVIVEIDHIKGYKPRPRAIRHLKKRLKQLLNKEIQIVASGRPIPKSEWDWAAPSTKKQGAAAKHQRKKTGGFIAKQAMHKQEGKAYIYVVSGPENQTKGEKTWLGAAYKACFFGDEVDYPVLALFQQNKIMSMFTGASTLTHESGHVLGLPGKNHTKDKKGHGRHCISPSCVFYPNPDVRSVLWQALPALFSIQVPTKFCKKCQKTLKKQRKGREG